MAALKPLNIPCEGAELGGAELLPIAARLGLKQ